MKHLKFCLRNMIMSHKCVLGGLLAVQVLTHWPRIIFKALIHFLLYCFLVVVWFRCIYLSYNEDFFFFFFSISIHFFTFTIICTVLIGWSSFPRRVCVQCSCDFLESTTHTPMCLPYTAWKRRKQTRSALLHINHSALEFMKCWFIFLQCVTFSRQ